MVKVGFIVEGDTEKIIVESAAFEAWLNSIDIELCRPVIDYSVEGNLLDPTAASHIGLVQWLKTVFP